VLSNVFIYIGAHLTYGCGGRAPRGDCNNNNNKLILIAILIKIITDGNLTLTKRLTKKNCTYIISVKKESVGLEGSRMGTKENDFKSEKTVFIGMLRKKNWNILLFRNIFSLRFRLTLKPAE
jgi:hypothetical protein